MINIMNNIKIIECNELYSGKVNNLLKDRNYIPKIENSKHVLLLLENETPIGIGSIWNSYIHPYRGYISIYIDPNKRNNGLGTMLFNELNIRYKPKNLQTAFDSNNINAVKFALKYGFKLVRRTYCYNVNNDMLKTFKYHISGEIVELNNLTKSQVEDAVNLQYEDYKINHEKINPLNKNINLNDWKKIIFDGLIRENSYVLIKNNNIAAYLFNYKIDATSIEIGYTGNRCNNIKEYKSFLYEVVLKLFESYKEIELEIDDCNTDAMLLMELFTFKPDKSWDTYIKDI